MKNWIVRQTSLRDSSGLRRNLFDHFFHQIEHADVVGLSVVIQQEPVAERFRRETAESLGRNVRPAFRQRADATATNQRLATARTRAPFDIAFDFLRRKLQKQITDLMTKAGIA